MTEQCCLGDFTKLCGQFKTSEYEKRTFLIVYFQDRLIMYQ